jgi:hypothetical protein
MVNDAQRRRLLIFDSTLTKFTVIADTAVGAPNSYGNGLNGLVPYLGDSTLFVERESQTFVVLDAKGKFVRTMAPPKPADVTYLFNSFFGMPGFDPNGRLVYRAIRRPPFPQPGEPRPAWGPDSAPIMRGDMEKRTVDTIAMMRVMNVKTVTVPIPGRAGTGTFAAAVNPLPSTDEWALLPDGVIAIVRGQDYHIDWVQLDGTRTSSPKMPFDWRRITAEEKAQIIDSVKKAHDGEASKAAPPKPGQIPAALTAFATVEPNELPDYYPPIRSGQVKADPEGNVWILPSTSTLAAGGLLYDVANRKGEVFERVRLPLGRSLAGFGEKGVVYMTSIPGPGQVRLERARVQ